MKRHKPRLQRALLGVGVVILFATSSTGAYALGWSATTSASTSITGADIRTASGVPTDPRCRYPDSTHIEVTWTAATNAGVRGYEVLQEQPVNGTFSSMITVSGVNTLTSGPFNTTANLLTTGWAVKGAAGTYWRSTAQTFELVGQACERISHTLAGPAPTGTVATGGFGGDGGAASAATLNGPRGLAFDVQQDTLYFADTNNNRIRAIKPVFAAGTPTIKTVAGNGTSTFAGDSGAATSASLKLPTALALNTATGDLYIADSGNNRIRMVHPSTGQIYTNTAANNIITTVVGTGAAGTGAGAGDGVSGGAVSSTELNNPQGISWSTFNSGTLFVSDSGHNRIRSYTASSSTVAAFSGDATNGTSGYQNAAAAAARYNNPTGLVCTNSSTCYVADTGNNKYRYLPNGGTHTTIGVAGGTTAGNAGDYGNTGLATYSAPSTVVFDVGGAVYVADNGNNRVRYASSQNQRLMYPVAGSGTYGSSGENVAANTVEMAGIQGLYAVFTTSGSTPSTDLGALIVAEGNRIRTFRRT